ncbi:MAG: hypothetical protein ACRDL6_05045 [Solirubrobacterales bacterium]
MWVRLALIAAALAVGVLAGCDDDSDGGGTTVGTQAGFEILGSWEGELTQMDLPPFRVTATIGDLDDPAANTVHYTGIDCGGNWTFRGEADAGVQTGDATRVTPVYRFSEVIDRGAGGSCKGVGTVTLTPTGADTVTYEFRGGGVVSRGTLTRQG